MLLFYNSWVLNVFYFFVQNQQVMITNAITIIDKIKMSGDRTFSTEVIAGLPDFAILSLFTLFNIMTGIVIPRAVQATPPTRPTSFPKDGMLAAQKAAYT